MDIVYCLGKGSKWRNKELMYSLRSVEKHCSNVGHVFIVGEDPKFVNGISILPYPDKSNYNKEKNIFEKLLHACENEYLSDDFLFMNDDHFFLQDIDITTIPYWSNGFLLHAFQRLQAGNTYRISLKNTWLTLNKAQKADFNFDVHTPIIYNKHKLKALQQYDWTLPYGLVIKSLYCNHHQISPVTIDDLKINAFHSVIEIFEMLKNRSVFSVGDGGLNDALKTLLAEKYPNPSLWEKSPV